MDITLIPDDVFFIICNFCLIHMYSLIFLSLSNRNIHARVHHYTTIWNVTLEFSIVDIVDNRYLRLIKWLSENKMDWKPDVCISKAIINEDTELLDWISRQHQGYRNKIRNTFCWILCVLSTQCKLTQWAYDKGYINKTRALELVKEQTSHGYLNAFEWGIRKNIVVRHDDLLYLLSYDHVFKTPIAQSLLDIGLVVSKEIKRFRMVFQLDPIFIWTGCDRYNSYYISRCHQYAVHKSIQMTQSDKKSNDDELESLINRLNGISVMPFRRKCKGRKMIFNNKPQKASKKAPKYVFTKQSNKRPIIKRYHR
jgi:hypothetical protein